METHRFRRCAVAIVAGISALSGTGTVEAAAAPTVTYVVPAGQTGHESRPTLTGAGRYSYLSPTMDRATANNQPNRALLKGEAYLGDGGATVTYRIKKLTTKPVALALWINYSDDAKHRSGTRDADISIPELRWSVHWSHRSSDTQGWKAVKVGTVTGTGGFTVRFRKTATTSAAFTLNAFALTNAPTPPPFNKVVGPFDGAWAGSYRGTIAGGPVMGPVAATVAGTVVTVTAPIKGTGTVKGTGEMQVGGSLGTLGVTCTYRGVLVAALPGGPNRGYVRSGTWTCTGPVTGSGTWEAIRR